MRLTVEDDARKAGRPKLCGVLAERCESCGESAVSYSAFNICPFVVPELRTLFRSPATFALYTHRL